MHISKSCSSIAVVVVILLVLVSVAAFVTPLSAGAGNATKTAVVSSTTARRGNASTAAVKTPPVVGASTWNTQTVDYSGGGITSLQLTPAGWPAISYFDGGNGILKYTYKDASGWHNQVVDGAGWVGAYSSLQLTPANWPAISYYDDSGGNLKYAYKSAS